MKTPILGVEDRQRNYNLQKAEELESWIKVIEFLISEHKYQKAEDAVRMALCLDPKCERLWIKLGTILSISNQIDEAKECFEQVLHLNPTNKLAKNKLSLLVSK